MASITKSTGLLIVMSSPSGGGKTTVRNRLLESLSGLHYSVSCTTRRPRAGENAGKDYFFLSEEEFRKMREGGEFLEEAVVHGSCYGTPAGPVDEALSGGRDVLLDVDTQGALQIRSKRDAVLIFILPPSLEILKARLYNRKTDSETEIWKRLGQARHELKDVYEYDYLVINDRLDMTVEKIQAIILAEKLRVSRRREILKVFESSLVEGK